MKKTGLLLAGIVMSVATLFSSCEKDCDCPSLPYSGSGGSSGSGSGSGSGGGSGSGSSGGSSGTITFWTDNAAVGNITVKVDNQYSGTISTISPSNGPGGCGGSGQANFTLGYGNHYFTATSATGKILAGHGFEITTNCALYRLR